MRTGELQIGREGRAGLDPAVAAVLGAAEPQLRVGQPGGACVAEDDRAAELFGGLVEAFELGGGASGPVVGLGGGAGARGAEEALEGLGEQLTLTEGEAEGEVGGGEGVAAAGDDLELDDGLAGEALGEEGAAVEERGLEQRG